MPSLEKIIRELEENRQELAHSAMRTPPSSMEALQRMVGRYTEIEAQIARLKVFASGDEGDGP